MNRADRRRAKKFGKEIDAPKVYNVNQFQMEQMKRTMSSDMQAECIKILFCIPISVAKNKYKWTDEQCQVFAEDICEEYAEYIDGNTMSIDEYVKFVEEASGIKLVKEV